MKIRTKKLTALQRRILELAIERGGLIMTTRPNRDARDLLERGLLIPAGGRWTISASGTAALR